MTNLKTDIFDIVEDIKDDKINIKSEVKYNTHEYKYITKQNITKYVSHSFIYKTKSKIKALAFII